MKAGATLVLTLVLASTLPCAAARAMGPGGSSVEEVAGAGPDPRLERTGAAGRLAGQVGDAVFQRPFYLVRLVAGVALLPVALPVAALFADWRDAIDICATGPYEMLFQRPLGE